MTMATTLQHFLKFATLVLFLACPAAIGKAAEFPGWQSFRVIEQKGSPSVLFSADIDGDDRQELIVVNRRSSRLDVYHWQPAEERDDRDPIELEQANELPAAVDFRHEQLQLEYPPVAAASRDLNGDGRAELIVLTSPPNRIVVYEYQGSEAWERQSRKDLLEGEIANRNALLLRDAGDGKIELLISFDEGVQRLPLEESGQASWITPRERQSRGDWWLADIDGDGHDDLIEQTRDSSESVRWHRAGAAGDLTSSAVLLDRSINDAIVVERDGAAQIAVLESAAENLVMLYELRRGDAHPLGRQMPISKPDGKDAPWCGMVQGDQTAAVLADPDRPRLLCYARTDDGWGPERSYPTVADIRAIAATQADPGTLLIWAKNAEQLFRCRWESGRLTYPKPWPLGDNDEQGKILALGSVGETSWWVQMVGGRLDLYRWAPGESEPRCTKFEKVGPKTHDVLWIGGDRLLVKQQHARAVQLVELSGEEVKISAPAHLSGASLAEFRLLPVVGELRLCRLTNGVLQWIGEDLQSTDQIMLPFGQKLIAFVPDDPSSGWALQDGEPVVHQMAVDDAGVLQAKQRFRIADGGDLVRDAVLGLVLVGPQRLVRLESGRPLELQLAEAIHRDAARSQGMKTLRFHRLGAADIDGDEKLELLLFDDLHHRLTAMTSDGERLVPMISWPVFDDQVYPYDDEAENLVRQPRTVVGADVDGDGRQDLAMICHDRLVIYLALDDHANLDGAETQ
ncbi:VCBS repeat-containing protein [Pirellulales bacterium]|nr:VCBS repeat-containing protein [Pirellulales bacterium]